MKYCMHCGAEMPDEAEFCTKCGKGVKKVSGEKATKKPLIIGCSIGIVLISIIVVGLFITGVTGGKKEAGLYDSDGKMIKTWEELQMEEFITVSDSTLRSSEKTRTLPGQLVIGEDVTNIGKEAFYDCSSLTSVTIPDNVTSIEDRAFNACRSLTNITIPDSVRSIGVGAFAGCSSLTSVTIPNSAISIGDGAFSGCKGLMSLTLPDSVTSIEDTEFCGCSSLTSLKIPNNVTRIGDGAFGGCRGLTSITIPDSVRSIGDGAFQECSSLTSIEIPDSVTTIGSIAFNNVSMVIYDGDAEGCPWGAKKVQKSDGTVLYEGVISFVSLRIYFPLPPIMGDC